MALPLLYSAGSLCLNGVRTSCKLHHTRISPCCAVQIPLRRPLSPQLAKIISTREQLLSSIAARTSLLTQPSKNGLSREAVELATFIGVLPARVRTALQQHTELSQLVEVVLDLGRPVVARFTEGAQILSRDPLTHEELAEVTSKARICTTDSCTAPKSCHDRLHFDKVQLANRPHQVTKDHIGDHVCGCKVGWRVRWR